MPADKEAARQRRKARNRQERANRTVRTVAVRREVTRPARTVESKPSKGSATQDQVGELDSADSSETSTKRSPSRRSGRRSGVAVQGPNGRPARTVSTVLDSGTGSGLGGLLNRYSSQPGGRPVLLAAFSAIANAVMVAFAAIVPVSAFEYYGRTLVSSSVDSAQREAALAAFDKAKGVTDQAHLYPLAGPVITAIVALMPLVIALTAVWALPTERRTSRLIVSAGIAMFYVVMSNQVGIYFMVGAMALAWGAYKSWSFDKAAKLADD